MALDQETINAQLAQLASHRQRLALLLQQQAKLGAYTPPYVLIDIQEAQRAIRNIKDQLRADGVPVADEPNDDVQPAAVAAPSRLAPQEQRNRSRMLDKVENFWINGVLEQSLYQITRLELGLEHAPEKISHPWETVLQQSTISRVVPSGTPIIKLFDDLDGKLLILGAPGSGKTTLLLELARDLIARARSDPQHPIPLVFNLSTWASKRRPLKEWLADELNQRYDVPQKLATSWVEGDAILPLLDGLDEVAVDRRDGCVEAINAYRHERSLVPLAVCSREEVYAGLADKLKLQGAVVIQPLTRQSVEGYLRQVGRPLAAVRAVLKDDPTLWELLGSPLLLSIVALAYIEKQVWKLRGAGTPQDRRRQLFDDYIAVMSARRGAKAQYTPQQTTHRLSWLARKMVQHSQTVFYIERMQPDWLPQRQRRGYSVLISILGGLVGALGIGLVGGLVGGLIGGLLSGLVGALGIGLVGGLGVGLGIRLGGSIDHIEVTETLSWSWPRPILVVSLVGGLLYGLYGVWAYGLVGGLLSGLGGALLLMLSSGPFSGLSGAELKTKATPNQGIRRSFRSWLVVELAGGLVGGLVGGLGVGLSVGLGIEPSSGLAGGLVGGLGFGLGVGLIGGLNFGGFAVLQHHTLRWLISHNRGLPFRDKNLVPFLDYCAERIFLRKVGGGYIFVHRLLMEHFASLYTDQPAASPSNEAAD